MKCSLFHAFRQVSLLRDKFFVSDLCIQTSNMGLKLFFVCVYGNKLTYFHYQMHKQRLYSFVFFVSSCYRAGVFSIACNFKASGSVSLQARISKPQRIFFSRSNKRGGTPIKYSSVS